MKSNEIKTRLVAVTESVKRMVFDIPKHDLADKLKISRNTLDRRIEQHSWTYEEKLIIDSLKTS